MAAAAANVNARRKNRKLSDLPDNFVECRRGHNWVRQSDTRIVWSRKQPVQHRENWTCSRCDATRWQELVSLTGEILRSGGTRDDDYGIGYRAHPADVRAEAFRRRWAANQYRPEPKRKKA